MANTRVCPKCGRIFSLTGKHISHIYCSIACFNSGLSLEDKAPRTLRMQILNRANYRCENCHKRITGPFHTHHKTNVKNGGDNSYNNLEALCISCHKEKHALKSKSSTSKYSTNTNSQLKNYR